MLRLKLSEINNLYETVSDNRNKLTNRYNMILESAHKNLSIKNMIYISTLNRQHKFNTKGLSGYLYPIGEKDSEERLSNIICNYMILTADKDLSIAKTLDTYLLIDDISNTKKAFLGFCEILNDSNRAITLRVDKNDYDVRLALRTNKEMLTDFNKLISKFKAIIGTEIREEEILNQCLTFDINYITDNIICSILPIVDTRIGNLYYTTWVTKNKVDISKVRKRIEEWSAELKEIKTSFQHKDNIQVTTNKLLNAMDMALTKIIKRYKEAPDYFCKSDNKDVVTSNRITEKDSKVRKTRRDRIKKSSNKVVRTGAIGF